LCPSNNPQRSRLAGIPFFVETLQKAGVNIWSVGIERNRNWQHVPLERILPIPYLVKPSFSREEMRSVISNPKIADSVFYVGDRRKNAVRWAGCDRMMVQPLEHASNMFVRVFNSTKQRIDQVEYNQRMKSSDFCLILCGDTPSSRSLSSAFVNGCIPIRVGSRLRGLCERPCKKGFGWTITGERNPHLPYPDVISWTQLPEVNEAAFARDPEKVLREKLATISNSTKKNLRKILLDTQEGWIYGFGHPLTSNTFGEAATYIFDSFKFVLRTHRQI